MATSRSLVLDTEDQTGKKSQKSFTAVNPDATINDMIGFAQLIVGLSTNTLKSSSYVEKTPLVAKATRNIILDSTSGQAADLTIDGLNVTIPSSAFTAQKDWYVSFGVKGTGVTSAQYSVTLPALNSRDAAAIGVDVTYAPGYSAALVAFSSLDETNEGLQTGEYKVLVHGDVTYEDEIITVTINE